MEGEPNGLVGTYSYVIDADKIALVERPVAALFQNPLNQLQWFGPYGIIVASICQPITATLYCILTAEYNGVYRQSFWKVLYGFFCGCSRKLKNMRNAGR